MADAPRTRALKDADGSDLVLTDLPEDSSIVVASKVRDAIPKKIHGFAVTVGLNTYPPDAPQSHRKAMYARLVPVEESARRIMQRVGEGEVYCMIPLSPEGAWECQERPNGEIAEALGQQAVGECLKILKPYLEAVS